MPEEDDEMPPLESLMDEGLDTDLVSYIHYKLYVVHTI